MPACPRDKTLLTPRVGRRFRVWHCKQCSGLWLPAPVVRVAVGRLTPPGGVSTTTLRCPDDGVALSAVHHRGVEVDVCAACGGVWLDHGELEQILCQQSPSNRRSSVLETAGDIALGLNGLGDVAELTGEVVGQVFEFLGDLLSGL